MALAAGLVGAGCHEVVAIPLPPFERSTSVLMVSEAPGDRLGVFADTAALPAPPNLFLGASGRVWALGFGCELERLDLANRDLDPERPESIPPLPVPAEIWRFTDDEGWRPFVLDATPGTVQAWFPDDGVEPCETYVPRPRVEPEWGHPLDLGDDEVNDPFLDAADDGVGGVVVLQNVLALERVDGDRASEWSRGLLLRLRGPLRDAEPVRPPDTIPSPFLLASRGPGRVVLVGRAGQAAEGPVGGPYRSLPPFPDLRPYAFGRLSVSGPDEPFEAFVIARGRHPVRTSSTSTLTVYRITSDGVETVRAAPTRPLSVSGFPRPDVVVRTGPGDAYALGFEGAGAILRIRGGTGEAVEIDPGRARSLVGLDHHPELGTVVADRDGQLYRRASGSSTWARIHDREGDYGPVALGTLDGAPFVAVYSATGFLGGGVRLVFPRGGERERCLTERTAIRPELDNVLDAADLTGVFQIAARRTWLLTSADDVLTASQVVLDERVGACGADGAR